MNGLEEFMKLAAGLGGFGVLSAVCWLVLSGRLRMAREVDAAKEELKKAEARAEMWQQAALRSLQNNQRLAGITERAVDKAATGAAAEPGGNTGLTGQGL